jgi:hypothetical protein
LLSDPLAESVIIKDVGRRDAGVAILFDVAQKSVITLLPRGGANVPCPARHVVESAFAVDLKGAVGLAVALRVDPLTEPVAIDRVGVGDEGVTVLFDVAQQLVETLLPLVGAPAAAGVPPRRTNPTRMEPLRACDELI